jgi:hypothetical protein
MQLKMNLNLFSIVQTALLQARFSGNASDVVT